MCITGCYNDVTGGRSRAVSQIDQDYVCDIHPRGAYFKALTANDLVLLGAFLTAYREGSFHYLLIAADKIGR